MRDILIILGMCLAAVAAGAWLFFSTPSAFTISPLDAGALTSTGKSPSTDTQVSTSTEAKPVEFTVIDTGTNSKQTMRKNYAIYSKDELGRMWDMAHESEPLPDVDFSKEYVVAIFAGQEPSGGYSIKVSGVSDTDTTRTVSIIQTVPGEGCVTTQALTSPYEFIRVPNSSLALAHADSIEATSCN